MLLPMVHAIKKEDYLKRREIRILSISLIFHTECTKSGEKIYQYNNSNNNNTIIIIIIITMIMIRRTTQPIC